MILRNKDGKELHLYRVTCELENYVLAENEQDAEDAGKDGMREELWNATAWATEIKGPTDYVDPEWLKNIPYGEYALDENGEEDELQVRDLLEMIKKLGDDRQIEMPLEGQLCSEPGCRERAVYRCILPGASEHRSYCADHLRTRGL